MPTNLGKIFTNAHGVKTIVAKAPEGHVRVYDLAKYLAKTKVPNATAKIVVLSAAAAVGAVALGMYAYNNSRKPQNP